MNTNMDIWQKKLCGLNQIDLDMVQSEITDLINGSPTEQAVQEYIENHCYLLMQARNGLNHSVVVTKPRLTDEFVADFVMFGSCNSNWVTFVEIEKPSDVIFTKNGDYSKAFAHALRQVADWREWIYNNIHVFTNSFRRPFSILFEIIIGRRDNLKNARHRLKAISHDITVSTFDSLLPCDNFGRYNRSKFVQKKALTFSEYKKICDIYTGREYYKSPWDIPWLWVRA